MTATHSGQNNNITNIDFACIIGLQAKTFTLHNIGIIYRYT